MSEEPQLISPIDEPRAASRLDWRMRTYWKPALLVGLLLYLYLPTLIDLGKVLINDPNSSHGLLVPPIVGYLIWRRRARLAEVTKAASPVALLVVLAGAVLLPLGQAAEVSALPPLSLLIVLAGVIWHIWGWGVVRVLLFPALLLLFALPWPGLLVETMTFQLSLFASKAAAATLNLLGIAAVREGVMIHMGGYTFEVAAPCSGIRSMAALMTLGALCAFLLKGSRLRRLILFATVPPLAMLGNAVRIVVILLIARTWGTKAAEGFYHDFSGIIVFMVTFLLLLAVARLIGLKQIKEEL